MDIDFDVKFDDHIEQIGDFFDPKVFLETVVRPASGGFARTIVWLYVLLKLKNAMMPKSESSMILESISEFSSNK